MRRPVDSAGPDSDFFATILLQVAAALFHTLIRRDGVVWVMAGI
jgi:cytochrome b561